MYEEPTDQRYWVEVHQDGTYLYSRDGVRCRIEDWVASPEADWVLKYVAVLEENQPGIEKLTEDTDD